MEQLALFGDAVGRPPLPPPLLERDVLFYALLLGPQLWHPASRLVTGLRDKHGLTGRMRPTDTFHISVLGFGFADEIAPQDVELAISIAERTRFAPFELAFDRIESLARRRRKADAVPLLLAAGAGSQEITALAARLTNSMIGHGMRPRRLKPSPPNLALLDDVVRVPPTLLDPSLRIEVAGFSLIRAHAGAGRYTVLWSPDAPRPDDRPAVRSATPARA
ncbi:MAG: hypothetical protein EOP22_00700 [Hyphomicrobiales bacterium]|nr:MAG: hypothetical protein EOP22_00700 [Hyphomicrobiales bacterium]